MRGKHVAALCLCGLLLPAAAVADWLVTRAGERIETAGPWRVDEEKQRVLFKLPSGALASLRLSEVDLEASRQATEEAKRPAVRASAPPPPPAAEAVLVLTDADVGHVEDRARRPGAAPESAAAGEESAAPEAEAATAPEAAPAAERLAVTSWQLTESPDYDGVLIRGQLNNRSGEVVVSVTLVVRLRDGEGELVASADAELTATSLPPGTSSNFRAEFPQIYLYDSVEFEADGFAVSSEPAETAPATVPSVAPESG